VASVLHLSGVAFVELRNDDDLNRKRFAKESRKRLKMENRGALIALTNSTMKQESAAGSNSFQNSITELDYTRLPFLTPFNKKPN
jgi:hypothetical protein